MRFKTTVSGWTLDNISACTTVLGKPESHNARIRPKYVRDMQSVLYAQGTFSSLGTCSMRVSETLYISGLFYRRGANSGFAVLQFHC